MKPRLSRCVVTCCLSRRLTFNLLALACATTYPIQAQSTNEGTLSQQVQQLTDAMARTQKQLEQSQQQLKEMQQQLITLQQQMAKEHAGTASLNETRQSDEERLATQVNDLREQEAMQESQIATQAQSKVESESKYPVKLTGLILLNGFVNAQKVDMAATPTVALPGDGSTGATLRQTILGIDARGPHIFGASSYADVHADFYGNAPSGIYVGGYSSVGLFRLRTIHAEMDWAHTQAFFSLDRPIINSNMPSSLTAVAIPELAWSGNLWNWNPQAGVMQAVPLSSFQQLRMQAALIDVSDSPILPASTNAIISGAPPPSTAENSRWPGVEARLSLWNTQQKNSGEFGVGGFFAPHRIYGGIHFDAWAATLDYRQTLPEHMELSGNVYRGLGLGGLGGGAYKDYVYRPESDNPGEFYFRALDDVGGWVQLKQRTGQRLEFNAAFGMDNVPAGQVRPYSTISDSFYQDLARNRTFTGNVIYSPSAYLLFSLEYRLLESSFINSPTSTSNIIGIAAGYKF